MLNEKFVIDDEFKYWWTTRYDALGKWMCKRLIMHRRRGMDNPYIVFEKDEEYQKVLKRITRLKKKGTI